ncbi:MAG: hypothetical protein EOP07_12060 [Proteobacteria bacterium]|nr:MAG: hypothetical protein EOP07_12060 [Pseudomonadota bacterium]
MFIFAGILSVLVAAIIISPLILAKDGALASASSLNSPERLLATKNAILKRYIEDEKTFEDKKISKIVWEQRKQYLSNRYIDAARRLDYINDLIATQKKVEAKPNA